MQYLEEKTKDFEIIKYLEGILTVEELTNILNLLEKKPLEMIRTQEDFYRKELKGKNFSDQEWIKLMVENPKLIHRPIIIKDDRAVWGDPPQNIDQLF